MGFIRNRLFEAEHRTDVKTGTLDQYDDFWFNLVSQVTGAGVRVSEKDALKYLTVFACVSLIAGDIAKLPLILYRRIANDGKERASDHPLYDLLHNSPNPETTSFNWRESFMGHLLLWGNHFGVPYINTYTGEVKSIRLIDNPGAVTVKRNDRGVVVYKWREKFFGIEREFVKPRSEMFHIAGFGFDGLMGKSMIAMAREAIGMGLATEKFGSNYFGKGTHPSGMITLPPEAENMEEEDQKKYIELIKKQYAGVGNSHSLMVMFNGEKYQPFTIPLEDAQFLQTRDHQKIEICGMYHVPPHKIAIHGQNSNYNNLEQENAGYLDSCLMHWIVRIEQAIAQQLLTKEERRKGYFVEFLLDGLMRANAQARAEFYRSMWNIGAINQNEIRGKENLNPVFRGDQFFVPLNMIPLDKADALADANIGDGGTNDGRSRIVEYRSVMVRDRIARQYIPLFKNAAQDIVNREGIAIKKQINQQRKQRSSLDMATWIDEFYRSHTDYIKEKIGPVTRSFSEAVRDAAMEEIGNDINQADFDRFVVDYVDRYAARHVKSSRGQLLNVLDEQGLDGLETRVDEWVDTRADKIAADETVRSGSAIFQFVAFAAGLSTFWRIRGPETCPYCKEFNGKRVRNGESFVNDGDDVSPEGQSPMKIMGMKTHPPLHQGCDCYLSAGV